MKKIKAKDLQPGDRIISTPWRGSRDEGRTITEVNHKIQIRTDHPSAGSSLYAEDTDLLIERPTPTITIEIPRSMAEHMAGMVYRDSRSDTVARACQKALKSDATPPVLRVGAKVRRLPRYERHDSTGRYGIGTVTRLVGGRHAIVTGPNGHDSLWDGYAFEVVG